MIATGALEIEAVKSRYRAGRARFRLPRVRSIPDSQYSYCPIVHVTLGRDNDNQVIDSERGSPARHRATPMQP